MRQRLLTGWSAGLGSTPGSGDAAPRPFRTIICVQSIASISDSFSRNSSMTNRARTDSLLLAGFCAFLFLYGLGQFGLIGADEPRYAQVAREMLERRDWVTPVLGGHPW